MNNTESQTKIIEAFEKLLKEQQERCRNMENSSFPDYSKAEKIVIGTIAGDGIGPVIMDQTIRVLNDLLEEELTNGKIELKQINGLTIENRLAQGTTLPPDVLNEIKECDLLLKGPTTTPDNLGSGINLESANVALRRELDLFANVRPVCIPEQNINWVFYRENTEGEYVLGSKGIDCGELAFDFKVTTDAGTERIARAAFEYAKANGNLKVSIVTKANIIKKTDGRFLDICYRISKEYPDIVTDDWYVDIMAANLINPRVQKNFNVIIAPNLYGDILTDEAAQIQGGVGTAGSANIGSKYAMFEAIHGSGLRMVARGNAHLANPASLLNAAEMMLRHIGKAEKANALNLAVAYANSKMSMAGDGHRDSAEAYTDAILSHLHGKAGL